MESVNFDLNRFLEEQNSINTQLISSNKNMGMAIKVIKEDAIDVLTEQVGEMRKTISGLENDIKNVLNENKDLKEDYTKINKDVAVIKDKTDVLEFEDNATMGKIKQEAKRRCTYLLGGSQTPQYITLFRPCILNLYKNISNSLCGGKRIGKIKVEDGQGAISMAKRYNLNDKLIKNKLQELITKQYDGLLTEVQSKALDKTIEWMEERI